MLLLLDRYKHVSANSGLPREKLVSNCQKNDTCVEPPQTIDDQGLVAPTILSSVDVFMTDATSINPSSLASV